MNLKVRHIIIEAHTALFTEISGIVKPKARFYKILLFDILPGLIAFYIVYLGNFFSKDSVMINYIMTTCSIFAGLLFSLIIVIVDKAKKMKETKSKDTENEFYYLSRYLRFSRHLITKIAFTIIVSLSIIILLIFANLKLGIGSLIPLFSDTKKYIISFCVIYLSIQFIYLIVNIISDMYDVFLEEIGIPN
jgi:hypothetical protein